MTGAGGGIAGALSAGAGPEAPSCCAAFAASPARHYMTDATGQVRCNAYIRLEYFETDAAPLFAHLGFAVTLPHLNRSRRDADYRDSYTPAAREAVADFCAEDIARFDYHFDAQGQT